MIDSQQYTKEEKYPLLFGNQPQTTNKLSPESQHQDQVLEQLEEVLLDVKSVLQPERRVTPRPLSPTLKRPVKFHSHSIRHQNWVEVIKEPLFKKQA